MKVRAITGSLLGALALSLVPVVTVRDSAHAAGGSVSVTVGVVAVVEGDTGAQQVAVPVTLSAPSSSPVTVQVTVGGGSADRDADWTIAGNLPGGAAVSFSTTIAPGRTSTEVRLNVVGDDTPEPQEQVPVVLSNPVGATLGTTVGDVAIGGVSILDDGETTSGAVVGIGAVVLDEGDEGVRTVKVPVTLSQTLPYTVDLAVTRAAASTASPGVDDGAKSVKRVRIPAGKLAASVSVPLRPDRLAEGDEFVRLQVSPWPCSASCPTTPTIVLSLGGVTIRDLVSNDVGALQDAPADSAAFYSPGGVPGQAPGEVVYSKVIASTALWTEHLVLYRSTGETGAPIVVSGRMWVPNASTPAEGFDVIAYGAGSTGLDDACAPSRYNTDVWRPADLDGLVAAGYVVAATDYEGLGTPGPNPYFGARSEAQTLFDSVRAVRDLGVTTSKRAVMMGWSRGGHAVVAASERASYAPDVDLRGVVGLGAGVVSSSETPLDLIMRFYPGYAMMVFRGLSSTLGTSTPAVQQMLAYYMTPNGISRLTEADTGCLFDVFAKFPSSVSSTLFNVNRPPAKAPVQAIRDRITVGARGIGAPLLLMSGTYDLTVPPQIIDPWLSFACNVPGRTAPITNRYYPQTHSQVGLTPDTTDLETWIADRFAGAPVTNVTC